MMKRRVFALTLSLLILGVAAAGCSEEAVRWTTNSKALDRKILKLQQGTSIEAVRSEFGKPESEFAQDREATLYYGLWQFVFIDGDLKRRTRDHELEHGPVPPFDKAWERKGEALDHKVLELHRGMPIAAVKAKLGTPESYEEVFEDAPNPEKILWYESWELTFTDGKLTMRSKR